MIVSFKIHIKYRQYRNITLYIVQLVVILKKLD